MLWCGYAFTNIDILLSFGVSVNRLFVIVSYILVLGCSALAANV